VVDLGESRAMTLLLDLSPGSEVCWSIPSSFYCHSISGNFFFISFRHFVFICPQGKHGGSTVETLPACRLPNYMEACMQMQHIGLEKTCTHSLYNQYGINLPVGFRIDVLLPNLQLVKFADHVV